MRQWDRFLTKAESAGHATAVREIHDQRARRSMALAELAGVTPVAGVHYVLNLDRSRDRLVALRQAAKACGFAPVRHRAIDASAPDFEVEAHFTHFPKGAPRTIAARKPGSFACFLGHRTMWERGLEEGMEVAALYEDDAVPLADPLRYLAKHPPPASWDVIKFSERVEPLGKMDRPYVPVREALVSHFRFAADLEYRHPPGNDAYLVSRRGMARLLEIFAEIGLPAALDYTLVRNGLQEDLSSGYGELDQYYNGRAADRQYRASGRPLEIYVTAVALSELAAVPSVLSPIRHKNREDHMAQKSREGTDRAAS